MAIKIKLYKEAYSKAITHDNTFTCLSAFFVSINYLIQTNYNFINVASFTHESFALSLEALGNFHYNSTHSITTFMHSFLVKLIVHCKSPIILCAINRLRNY